MLGLYYASFKVKLPFFLLASAWRGDCSDVNRCWRLSEGLLNGGDATNYICTSRLSAQLPLWSNSRHCAECPALWTIDNANFPKTDACDPEKFGGMDSLAGAYFDFWSGELTVKPGPTWSASFQRQRGEWTLHDVNGPYNSTCSKAREGNSDDQAGWAGGDNCIDCFGMDCVDRSFSNMPAANVEKKSHCEERFACSAFDFDRGQCEQRFFSSVCNASGNRTDYPRRFSDLPGFDFFRDWPHSYVDSCSTLSTNATAHLSARQRLQLRALCQVH